MVTARDGPASAHCGAIGGPIPVAPPPDGRRSRGQRRHRKVHTAKCNASLATLRPLRKVHRFRLIAHVDPARHATKSDEHYQTGEYSCSKISDASRVHVWPAACARRPSLRRQPHT